MTAVKELICKNCGANIDLSREKNGIVRCEYCESVFTLPKNETNPAALSFLRQGEHDLDTGKFDDAYTAYAKAAELDKNEPEAYWGMALAEFRVQYLKDTVNNRLQPICSDVSGKDFTLNKNYQKAISLATQEQKAEYRNKGEEIDDIRRKFYGLKNSGLNYDCFICVKVTDENGAKTEDYKDADYIYNLLQENGFKPFFSERILRNQTGADYEAMILYALYTSETMLVVCRNEEYLQTTWVKNEYTRFLKLVNDEEKESDSITFVYYGKPIEKLPGKNGKIQGIDFSRRDADGKIVKFVEEHTPVARAKREEAARKKEQEAEELRRQIAEQKSAQASLEERLKNLNVDSSGGSSSTVASLLTRANQELEINNFDKAKQFCENVLERAPENADAWWKLFLIDFRVTNTKFIIKSLDYKKYRAVTENNNYNYASRYASGQLKEEIENFENQLRSPLKWWNLFLKEMGVNDEYEITENITRDTLNLLSNSINFDMAYQFADQDFKVRIDSFNKELKEKVCADLSSRTEEVKATGADLSEKESEIAKQLDKYKRLTSSGDPTDGMGFRKNFIIALFTLMGTLGLFLLITFEVIPSYLIPEFIREGSPPLWVLFIPSLIAVFAVLFIITFIPYKIIYLKRYNRYKKLVDKRKEYEKEMALIEKGKGSVIQNYELNSDLIQIFNDFENKYFPNKK